MGILNPATRLLGRLRFARKFALIGLVFAATLGTVGYLMVSTLSGSIAVAEGAQTVGATVLAMDDIQASIVAVSSKVREIETSGEEQARTIVEVTRQVEGAAREVSQNASAAVELAATVQEVSRTATDLAKAADHLAASVSAFRV
jgi:methyl-accepting chemotaxis protein